MEPLDGGGVADQARGEHLQGDASIQRDLKRLVHDPHGSTAEPAFDAKVAQLEVRFQADGERMGAAVVVRVLMFFGTGVSISVLRWGRRPHARTESGDHYGAGIAGSKMTPPERQLLG
jgi:hypothetical protein